MRQRRHRARGRIVGTAAIVGLTLLAGCAPARRADTAPAAPPAAPAAAESWRVELVQGGTAHDAGHGETLALAREPFVVRAILPSEDELRINVAADDAVFRAAAPGRSLESFCQGEVAAFCPRRVFAGSIPPDRAIWIGAVGHNSWNQRGDDAQWHRSRREDGRFVVERDVEVLRAGGRETPVAETELDRLYLTFLFTADSVIDEGELREVVVDLR